MNHKSDVIILGAGAAGMLCAVEAGKRGRNVVILEGADRAGEKILISGGGRCNFTNLYCSPENFLSTNPHFAKSALARYTPADFIALVEKHRIPYHEKTKGQLFCDGSAREIVNMLDRELRDAGVKVVLNSRIQQVTRSDQFTVHTRDDDFTAPVLVVATGGLSIPKLGATSLGYDLARQFGLKIEPPRPALSPLLFGSEERTQYCDLAGVSTEIVASTGSQSFRESMLITHRGLSGPAILQISSYWRPGDAIQIDLAPDRNILERILEAKIRNQATQSAVLEVLPKRLGMRWLDLHAPTSWTNQALEKLEYQLHHWDLKPSGIEGFDKAEVTAGGVSTDELSSKTMESRAIPGLYFIGEVVDVTGHLGGFNFQWAWASGAAAGTSL